MPHYNRNQDKRGGGQKHSKSQPQRESRPEAPKTPPFPLPHEVSVLVGTTRAPVKDDRGRTQGFRYEIGKDQDNLFLAFFRYVPNEDRNGRSKNLAQPYLTALKEHWRADGVWRKAAEAAAGRLTAQAQALETDSCQAKCFEMTTEGRLLVGMGYKNALEVGLTLHPLYGFPYLPGTAVKGLARAWAEQVAHADKSDCLRIFGTETKDEKAGGVMQLGAVTFLDALPTSFPRLEVDIMNPHFPNYYSDKKDEVPPAVWQNPVPIPFLTVALGCCFRFVLASHDADALKQAAGWLKQGLLDLGAGGKTSAGYGYFQEASSESTPNTTGGPTETRSSQSAPQSPAQAASDPSQQPKLKNIGKNTTRILAQVVGRQGHDLTVRLHAEGYEEDSIPMIGQYNRDGYEQGEWVTVDVEDFSSKVRRATSVRYARRFHT